MGLWWLLVYTESGAYVKKGMGMAASLFAVLIMPELWKNRNTGAMEIEGTTFYTLRQMYAANRLDIRKISISLDFILSSVSLLSAELPTTEKSPSSLNIDVRYSQTMFCGCEMNSFIMVPFIFL